MVSPHVGSDLTTAGAWLALVPPVLLAEEPADATKKHTMQGTRSGLGYHVRTLRSAMHPSFNEIVRNLDANAVETRYLMDTNQQVKRTGQEKKGE